MTNILKKSRSMGGLTLSEQGMGEWLGGGMAGEAGGEKRGVSVVGM